MEGSHQVLVFLQIERPRERFGFILNEEKPE